MNLQNLKRAQFIQRFAVIVAFYFFIRAIVQIFSVKQGAAEHIANYLVIVIFHSLILQIVKAEQYRKLNQLLPLEIIMFLAAFLLIGLEFIY